MVHLEWQEDANLVKYLSVLLQLSRKRYGGAIRARRFSELNSNIEVEGINAPVNCISRCLSLTLVSYVSL
jgi:hypothetical protein